MSAGAISAGSLFWIDSLWRASWQGGLLIMLVWAVCRGCRRLPPAIACWLWWLASLKLLVSLASPAPLTVTLSAPPRSPVPTVRLRPALLPRGDTTAAADTITGLKSAWYADAVAARRAPPPPVRLLSAARQVSGTPIRTAPARVDRGGERPVLLYGLVVLLLALWAAGVAVRLRAVFRLWRSVRRLAREARPLEDPAIRDEAGRMAAALGLRRLPPIRESAAVPGPVVIGLLGPRVLLPAGAAEPLSPRERQMVLAHERAHVRRQDLPLALVPGLAQALFFFHPLVGIAGREWATAREAACDAAALAATGVPAAAYGHLLLKLAASQRGAALPALGVSGSYRSMQQRLALLRSLAPPPRRLRVGLALVIAAVALGVLPLRLAAMPAPPREHFAIERVKALAKPITLTETRIPLGDLVREISTRTGVPLSAAPNVADEPVAVVVKDYPAGRLLQELADLLDYRWHVQAFRRSGVQAFGGDKDASTSESAVPERLNARTPERLNAVYEIWQDLASKQWEEALRQALRQDALKRFQARLGQLVAVAEQSPEQIAAIQDALEKDPAVKRLPVSSPERHVWEDRSSFASQVATPVPRALALLLGRLTGAEWTRLRSDQRLIFSTDPAPGQQGLPEEIAQTFRSAKPSWLPPGQKPSLGHMPDAERLVAMMRQAETETQSRWSAATGFRVVVRLTGNELRPGGFLSLTARAEPLQGGAPDPIPHPIGTDLMLTAGVGDALIQREPDNPERRASLARDPTVGATKPFRTSKKRQAFAPPDANGGWTTQRDWGWGRWDQLPELARTYGVNFIADAYWTSGVQSAYQIVLPLSTAPVPLYKLLDDLVSGTHHWDRHGDLIRLRSRTWFLDRPRDIPMRLIRRWNSLLAQNGALPLDEDVRIVTTLLSDDQLDTMNLLAFDGVLGMSLLDQRALVAAKDTLRLYAALLPDQREALWRGLPLPAARMTPAQRQLLQTALERDDSRDAVLTDRELAATRFSLTAQPRVVVVEQHPDRITYQVEDIPASGARPAAAMAPAPPPGTPAAQLSDAVRRYPVEQITFHYQVGARRVDLAPLTVAPPDHP